MSETHIALFAIHAVFAGSFILAFSFPLAIAGAEERCERLENLKKSRDALDALGPLLDIWLIMEDVIPVFWILRLLRNAPDDTRAAIKKWREEPAIRLCFWIALVLTLTLPVYFIVPSTS